ncbi:MAG: hypothetical protein KatS3mg111_3782 [Pirellulaceae bacterium]|nr:MAG: hypothetical protein KatS3mg111_3782 [Pirellulaceae bacterium]
MTVHTSHQQESSNGADSSFPPRQAAQHISDLLHDVLHLAELQIELFQVDLRDGGRRVLTPVVTLGLSLALAVGAIPVLLAAIAAGLMAVGLALWLSILLAGLLGLLLAATAAWLGLRLLKRSFTVFQRSADEFRENYRWIKHGLTGRSPRPSTSCTTIRRY